MIRELACRGRRLCPSRLLGLQVHAAEKFLVDARRLVEGYVEHYNNVRLNSAIGYITPKDMLAGKP